MSKGLIKEVVHTFADQAPSRFLNLIQADDVRLSDGQQGLFISRNLPKIHTSDYKMAVTAGADTITLSAGVGFDVGGVIFSTDDLTSRVFTIPDGTTKYLYAAVADDCGEAVDWSADPIQRKLTAAMTLEDAKVDSTPIKMLILKAVKGAAGSTPTVTLYANEGRAIDHAVAVQTGQIEGLWVDRSDADTLSIAAGWCHLRDSSGTDHLVEITSDQTLDVTLSGDGVGYVYVSAAGALSWSLTAPTRSAAKGGYYDATGDLRYLGAWPYASSALLVAHRNGREVIFESDVGLYSGVTMAYVDVDMSDQVPAIDNVLALVFGHAEAHGTRLYTRKKRRHGHRETRDRGERARWQTIGRVLCFGRFIGRGRVCRWDRTRPV